MLEKRLHAFSLWQGATLPKWGPSLVDLDLENIQYYIDPTSVEQKDWNKVPDEIKETFEIISEVGNQFYVRLKMNQQSNDILAWLLAHDVKIKSFNELLPTFNEIFIKTVNEPNHE